MSNMDTPDNSDERDLADGMSEVDELVPLVADSQRQAHASLRGYLYQIWVSVLAWLELGDDEILYLEGAEDIDRIFKEGAEAVQVKDRSANVTLKSPDVVETIGNYWELKSKNPNRKIKFRFLTTAASGLEQGAPFGDGVKGLDCWRTACRSPEAAAMILDFLKTIDTLPSTLVTWLQTASVEEVINELIDPVVWETGAGDAGFVEAEVERKIGSMGENYGVFPEEAKKAIPALLKEAFETASSKSERTLDRTRLREVLQNATTILVPRADAQVGSFAQQLAGQFMSLSGSPGKMHLSVQYRVQKKIPDLPDHYISRDHLVSDCLQVLTQTGFFVLTGSVGMGKTTLAKLIAREGGRDWLWVNLSEVPSEGVAYVLRFLGEALDAEPHLCNVLLDDIDLTPGACREYESALGGLMMTLHERKGCVIITSQREPTQRLQRALSLQGENVLSVPSLTEEEMILLLNRFGFPKGEESACRYAKLIRLQTSGHPQLVLALINNYCEEDWPNIDVETLLKTPEGVLAEKKEARQILSHTLSSSEQSLIYRLSILSVFRRDQAVLVGQMAGVQASGDIFDHLAGPWVEEISEDYYRVSPLVANAAIDALGPDEILAIHSSVAESLLAAGKLNQHDVNSIFMHAFMGKNARVLLIAINGVWTADERIQGVLFNELSWFLAFDPPPGTLIFQDDVFLNSMLRMLQFRIAVSVNSSKAEHIAERWDAELVDCEPHELFLLQRFMYVLVLLLHFQAPIHPDRLIACFSEMEELLQALPDLAEKMREMELPGMGEFQEFDISDPVKFFFGITLSRCSSADFLQKLFVSLDSAPPALRNRMLSTLSGSAGAATLLIDRVWLTESNLAEPDWALCLEVFDEVKNRGIDLAILNLSYAAARGTAVIYDEYLDDPKRALAELDSVEADLGVSPVTQDSRATVLYNRKQYKDALAIWESCIANLGQSFQEYDLTIWTARKAAISASQTGDWHLCASFFMQGYEKGKLTGISWCTVGFLGDAAFSFWMAGEYPDMLDSLLHCLQLLAKLPDSREDFTTFSMEKMIATVLLWINGELTGVPEDKRNKPYAGLCSDSEPNEKLRGLPHTAQDYLWLLLVEIEHELSLGDTVYNVAKDCLDGSTYAVVQMLYRSFQLSYSIEKSEYHENPSRAFLCARSMTVNRSLAGDHNFVEGSISESDFLSEMNQSEIDSVTGLLMGALISFISRQESNAAICAWGNVIRTDSRLSCLLPFLDEIEEIFSLSSGDSYRKICDQAGGWRSQTLAAIHICVDSEVSPNELFNAHSFIFNAVRRGIVGKDAVAPAAEIISKGWAEMSKCPALLHTPRISVPPLKAACKSDRNGIQKIADILLAASDAISMHVPSAVIDDLRGVRN